MSTSMREALKPCPFCGSKSLTLTVNEHHWKIVECDDCGMRGPCIDLEDEEYLARWNTRAALSSPAPDRLSERLREVNGDTPVLTLCGLLVEAAAELDRLSRQPEAEPVAWTNEAQLGFLKEPAYAAIPMAMWAKRLDGPHDIALYTSPRLDRETTADDLRALGWTVAVHNDYRLNGLKFTFWLFTKDGRAVKGEGRTDAEALKAVADSIMRETR